jgi:hypothetical protein
MLIRIITFNDDKRQFNGFTVGLVPVFRDNEVSAAFLMAAVGFKGAGAGFNFRRIILFLAEGELPGKNQK